jgi:hypothetical protein
MMNERSPVRCPLETLTLAPAACRDKVAVAAFVNGSPLS